ncbi:MAG: SoxR reducing system RseC family protein [Granulosicoccus sp.]
MKRQARVVSVDSSDGTLVEIDSMNQCLRCSRGQGCGAGVFSGNSHALSLQVHSPEQQSLRIGQQVQVEIDESGSQWLWPVFCAYGLPLFGMLLATAVSSFFTNQYGFSATAVGTTVGTTVLAELAVMLSAVAGLAGGIFAWHKIAPRALAFAQRGICLHSARIVAINPSSEREH